MDDAIGTPNPWASTPAARPAAPDPNLGCVTRFNAMGGEGEIRLAGVGDAQAQGLLAKAVTEIRRIEAKYSRYLADSLVSAINASAGTGQAVTLDDETTRLLAFASSLFQDSEGRFDITSGVLRRAWDFRSGKPPRPPTVAGLLPLVGWRRVRWEPEAGRIELPMAGMEVDFGGFGKEYAADRASALLIESGARHGYVNLAGDIRVIGPKADGSAWQFGIRDPRRLDATVSGIGLTGGALATSGDYERYIEVGGRRYCHILDPRTGWPVGHWRSVSVVAPLCVAAGALSTVAMLMRAEAPGFLASQGALYLAIGQDGRVFSDGSKAFHGS